MTDYVPIETNYAVATGEWLQEWQEDNEVSTSDLAERLHMTVEEVEAILIGSTAVDEDIASKLEGVTGLAARLWINFEKRYAADLTRLNLDRPQQE